MLGSDQAAARKGADAKARDIGGATALEPVVSAGDSESVRLPLAAGADTRNVSRSGMTPLLGAPFSIATGVDPDAAGEGRGSERSGDRRGDGEVREKFN